MDTAEKQKEIYEDEKLHLYYKLIGMKRIAFGEELVPRDVYSLLIVKEKGGEIEYSFFFDISSNKKNAERIKKLFENGRVCPDTAGEILEELL